MYKRQCLNCSKHKKECRYDFKATNRRKKRRQATSLIQNVDKEYIETDVALSKDLLSKSNANVNAPSDFLSSSASNSPYSNGHYSNLPCTLPFMGARSNNAFNSGGNIHAENNTSVFAEDHMAKLLLQLGSKLRNTTKESSHKANEANGDDDDVNTNLTTINIVNNRAGSKPNCRSGLCGSSEALDSNNINSEKNKIISSQITNMVNGHFESPWQTFSLDKYRFHRRYQNILPYYLGASILMDLSPETIEYAKLKRPRAVSYTHLDVYKRQT